MRCRCTTTKACGFIYRNSSDGTAPEVKEFRPSLKGHRTLKTEIQDYAYYVYSAEFYLCRSLPARTVSRSLSRNAKIDVAGKNKAIVSSESRVRKTKRYKIHNCQFLNGKTLANESNSSLSQQLTRKSAERKMRRGSGKDEEVGPRCILEGGNKPAGVPGNEF